MQTTHKIPGDSAAGYAAYLTSSSSRGDYYTGNGEESEEAAPPGRWHGSPTTLRALGLDPHAQVRRDELRALMQGLSPADGSPIRPVGANGSRVAGIDLTFSPPKTVSALWAVSGEYRRAQIEAAHTQAVRSAIERIERDVELVRRRSEEVVRFEKAHRLLAAEFVHTTSRLARDEDRGGVPDPQLHSHVLVIAAERTDGRLAAVESKQLFRSARENGAWYRSELAANLQELGLQVDRRTGRDGRYFEVKGVPRDLAERWSARARDVDRAARLFRSRYGRDPRAGELGALTVQTRGSKTAAATIDVNRAWEALGQEHGLGREQTQALFAARDQAIEQPLDLRRELPAAVTERRSMISERECSARAYELSAGTIRPLEAQRVVNELARSGELVRLQDGMWTSRELREREREAVRTAMDRGDENVAPVSDRALREARQTVMREIGGPLTGQQRDALERIAARGGVSVLVGQAGTGKGVVLRTASEAWRREGYEVLGIAIAGATAKRLGADAKLERSMTTDALLNRVDKGHVRVDSRTVVVMDEAGMADSERLGKLIEMTAEREAKLVLAGDCAQLPSIGAGGLFREIEKNVPAAELTEVMRARHAWEKQAWMQIREGEAMRALARYSAHDRLHIYDTRREATEAMVAGWDRQRIETGAGRTVMITDASNKERDEINAMAQERRAQAGELGAHQVELPGKPYGLRAGDEIVFTAQHHEPGQERVENGITGTITNTERDEDRVTIRTRETPEREVNVDTSEFGGLSLAYAVHVYKAQGLTAERSSVLIGGWQTDRETAYVSVSRAREQTDIYLTREDLGEQGMDPGAIERLADRIEQSNAQEASITRETAPLAHDRPAERDDGREHESEQSRERDRDRDQEIEREQEQDRDRDRDTGLGLGIE